jgi:hypothetical protein
MSRARKSWVAAVVAAVAVGSLTATAIPGQAAPVRHTPRPAAAPAVVASGLHNPRTVRIQSDGAVLVTEGGSGSATPCTSPVGTINRCLGFTGSVYREKGKSKGRVVTGLPSEMIIRLDGTGVVNGAIQAESDGNGGYRVLYGLSGLPADRTKLGAGAGPLGTLSTAKGRLLGDLAQHELVNDPDAWTGNGEVFSNPWGFAKDGRDFLVADAGANDLLRIRPDGTTETVFVFPNNVLPPAASSSAVRPLTPAGQLQAVPTGIVRGADGAFYISDLSAMKQGLSRIWRYVPGSTPTVFATGLTDVIDLALAPDGSLVALSYGTRTSIPPSDGGPGALTRIDQRTGALTPIDTGGLLNLPTGVAVDRTGDIYVSNNTQSTSGELLKFPAS